MAKKLVFAAVLLCSFALHAQIIACPGNVTAADYAGLTCYQDDMQGTGRVTYHFPSNWFVSTGSKTVTPSQLTIRLDPNGAYTFLFSSTQFSVDQHQQVKVVLNFQVSGATMINPWTHGCVGSGNAQIGFSEEVFWEGPPPGDVTAMAVCPNDDNNPDPQDPQSFEPVGAFQYTQIIMELDAGSGSATVTSFGAHYHPPKLP